MREPLLATVLIALAVAGCALDEDATKHACVRDEHCTPGRFCVLGRCAAAPLPPPPEPPDASNDGAQEAMTPLAAGDGGEDAPAPPIDAATPAPPSDAATPAPPIDAGGSPDLSGPGLVPDAAPASLDLAPEVDAELPTVAGCKPGELRSDDRCLSGVVAVGAAHFRTCAVRRDGTVWCWGRTAGTPAARPVQVPGISDARAVALGGDWYDSARSHACVLTSGQELLCWGSDSAGQLGDGDDSVLEPERPRRVVTSDRSPLTGVREVALSDGWGCASTATAIYCWGTGSFGQLALPGNARRPFATLVADVPPGQVAVSYQGAISADRKRACGWGNGTPWPGLNALSAPACLSIDDVRQVGMGYHGGCFRRDNGDVSCWGYSLGVRHPPGARTAIRPATHLAAGWAHACARQDDGRVICWGRGSDGELGTGPQSNIVELPPNEVKALGTDTAAIFSGPSAHHTCVIRRDNSLWCWGLNHSYQLGNSAVGTQPVGPVPVKW